DALPICPRAPCKNGNLCLRCTFSDARGAQKKTDGANQVMDRRHSQSRNFRPMIIPTRPSAEAKRARLRSVLHGDRCIMAASTYDPLSARVAEDLDFEVGVLGGSAAALAVLGVPDITLITL